MSYILISSSGNGIAKDLTCGDSVEVVNDIVEVVSSTNHVVYGTHLTRTTVKDVAGNLWVKISYVEEVL